MTMGQFACFFRRRLRIEASDAIFFFVGNAATIVPSSMTFAEIARAYASDDSIVDLTYSGENTFGAAAADLGRSQLNGNARPQLQWRSISGATPKVHASASISPRGPPRMPGGSALSAREAEVE
jgi:hypothetical protein